MSSNNTSKQKAHTRGRYKLGVFFKDHQGDGNAKYFHSNTAQDRVGSSISRFKNLVAKKWAGKVSWAGLYEDKRLIYTYTDNNKAWSRV